MTRPSTYPREPRRFNCLRCGCDVWRPESDRFDDLDLSELPVWTGTQRSCN